YRRKPVRGRDLRRPHTEVPSENRRRSIEARGPPAARNKVRNRVRSAEPSAFALTAGDLSLLPLARSDANELHALWTTPSVRRFLWDGEIIPFERTVDIV